MFCMSQINESIKTEQTSAFTKFNIHVGVDRLYYLDPREIRKQFYLDKIQSGILLIQESTINLFLKTIRRLN